MLARFHTRYNLPPSGNLTSEGIALASAVIVYPSQPDWNTHGKPKIPGATVSFTGPVRLETHPAGSVGTVDSNIGTSCPKSLVNPKVGAMMAFAATTSVLNMFGRYQGSPSLVNMSCAVDGSCASERSGGTFVEVRKVILYVSGFGLTYSSCENLYMDEWVVEQKVK